MSIAITGDLDWVGDLVLFLEALDGGPAADVAGYAFTSSGDIEYSCSVPEPVDPDDRLLGLYRCVAKTAGDVRAGVGYVTIEAATTATAIRSERAAELNTEYLFDDGFGRKAVNANVTHYQGTLQGNGDLPAKLDAIKDVTNKIDTGLVLDGVVWQFTVNMLEAAIAEVPKYGDIQRHAQEDYDVTSKTVDVTVTKVT